MTAPTFAQPSRAWIDDGAIGTLREIHNWSNRPVWPQYPTLPTDTPPDPAGLRLGPVAGAVAGLARIIRTYTHAVFRGWYEFGGGSLADMGHYSLWPVFTLLSWTRRSCVESHAHSCLRLRGQCLYRRCKNDYSFPAACTIRFKFAAKGSRPAARSVLVRRLHPAADAR